jgi:hypothetical protein
LLGGFLGGFAMQVQPRGTFIVVQHFDVVETDLTQSAAQALATASLAAKRAAKDSMRFPHNSNSAGVYTRSR